MSVHDAIEAWRSGEITAALAMTLSGAKDVTELHALAESCGFEIDPDLDGGEREAAVVVGHPMDRATS